MRKRDWVGRRVKTLRTARVTVSPGMTFTVVHSYGGLTLQSGPCGHCGITLTVNRVPIRDVEPIRDGT